MSERPLAGKRVLVTRPRHQSAPLVGLLREAGAEAIELALIEIAPMEDQRPLTAAVSRLRDYDWVIFTSVNGVEAVFSDRGNADFSMVKVAAIGPSTAAALSRRSIRVDFLPREFVAEAIVEGIGDVSGSRILLPRAAGARQVLAEGLRRRGAVVDDIPAYRTVPCAGAAQTLNQLLHEGMDVVTFLSSSTVRAFADAVGDRRDLRDLTIACIGPITAATAKELGFEPQVIAEEYTAEGLVRAISFREGWEKKEEIELRIGN